METYLVWYLAMKCVSGSKCVSLVQSESGGCCFWSPEIVSSESTYVFLILSPSQWEDDAHYHKSHNSLKFWGLFCPKTNYNEQNNILTHALHSLNVNSLNQSSLKASFMYNSPLIKAPNPIRQQCPDVAFLPNLASCSLIQPYYRWIKGNAGLCTSSTLNWPRVYKERSPSELVTVVVPFSLPVNRDNQQY